MINKPRTQNGISTAGPAPLETTEKLASKKRLLTGFTMIEVMITLIILSVLTAIAIPMYEKTVDEMHKKEAKAVLGTIRSAELMYKIDHNNYTAASFGSDAGGDNSRSTLNADIYDNADWEYGVTGTSGTGVNAAATATAARLRGKHGKGTTSPGSISINVTDGEPIAEYPW